MAITGPGDDDETLLRRFESDVLDGYHEGLAIWQLPRPEGIYAVIAAYDSMILVIGEVQSRQQSLTHLGPFQYLKGVDEGFCQALRWITAGRVIEAIQPTSSSVAIDAGGALLMHAAEYVRVAAFHILYSRGVVSARVNERDRLVRFERRNTDRPVWETFAERSTIYEQKPKPSDEMQAKLLSFVSRVPYDLVSGRIALRDPTCVIAPEVQAVSRITMPTVALSLDADADLGSFSMSQFRSFWFALYCWSQVLLLLFMDRASIKRQKQATGMPTQLMSVSEFVTLMAEISRLDRAAVAQIVDRLSYDPTTPKADPFLTPLLRPGDQVCWAPLSIALSRAERNILKAMARTAVWSNHVSTLIGAREVPMLRDLGLLLAKKGQYSYGLRKNISAGDEHAELDLLAWKTEAPNEVLIIEAKALLTPGDAGETVTARAEILRAQAQLLRAAQILKDSSLDQRRGIYPFVSWEHVDTYRLLILTPDSQFGHAIDESLTPVLTLEAAKLHLRRRSYASPSVLWEACKARSWLATYPTGPSQYSKTTIGDVTYELPYTGDLEGD